MSQLWRVRVIQSHSITYEITADDSTQAMEIAERKFRRGEMGCDYQPLRTGVDRAERIDRAEVPDA